jgi:hypothetical protein
MRVLPETIYLFQSVAPTATRFPPIRLEVICLTTAKPSSSGADIPADEINDGSAPAVEEAAQTGLCLVEMRD